MNDHYDHEQFVIYVHMLLFVYSKLQAAVRKKPWNRKEKNIQIPLKNKESNSKFIQFIFIVLLTLEPTKFCRAIK